MSAQKQLQQATSGSSKLSATAAASKPRESMAMNFAVSGLSVGSATACTNPIDIVKVRMQLRSLADGGKAPGMVKTAIDMVKTEGPLCLTRGLGPAVFRSVTYGGVRLGLYKPLKKLIGADEGENPSILKKIAAGSVAGAIAGFVSNPLDLVKVRLQANGAAAGNTFDILGKIAREDGMAGLWKGSTASMSRAAILTTSQCVTYDIVKAKILEMTGWKDDFNSQLAASMITGIVTTTATSPVDVIKTQMFVNGARGVGPLQCAANILKTEGAMGLMKGWTANYTRLGPQTIITFLVAEKLRALAGMTSF